MLGLMSGTGTNYLEMRLIAKLDGYAQTNRVVLDVDLPRGRSTAVVEMARATAGISGRVLLHGKPVRARVRCDPGGNVRTNDLGEYRFTAVRPGRVNLYVGQDLVVRNVPQDEAPDRLLDVIAERLGDPPI